eukprot:2313279-Amphidinium_carterae.2
MSIRAQAPCTRSMMRVLATSEDKRAPIYPKPASTTIAYSQLGKLCTIRKKSLGFIQVDSAGVPQQRAGTKPARRKRLEAAQPGDSVAPHA